MSGLTHDRARKWASDLLGADDLGAGGTFHLRDARGRRIRVVSRHVESREPNYFALGPSFEGDPFDDLIVILFESDWTIRYAYRLPLAVVVEHHRQPGVQGCRLMIRGDDSWREDPRAERLA